MIFRSKKYFLVVKSSDVDGKLTNLVGIASTMVRKSVKMVRMSNTMVRMSSSKIGGWKRVLSTQNSSYL